MKVSRSELHTLVLSEPMQRFAKRLGLSEAGLAKRCRKLDIPVPGRGYWARKVAGQKVHVPKLPKGPLNLQSNFLTFMERPVVESPPEVCEGPGWEQEQFEGRPENHITIPERLSRRHVIRATAASLRGQRGPKAAEVRAWGEDVLNLAVSREHATRALQILDAFVDACESRGFVVRGETCRPQSGPHRKEVNPMRTCCEQGRKADPPFLVEHFRGPVEAHTDLGRSRRSVAEPPMAAIPPADP